MRESERTDYEALLPEVSAVTRDLAKRGYELQSSVHRMTAAELDTHRQMESFRALLPLEMQGWQAPPKPEMLVADDANGLFTRSVDGKSVRLDVRASDRNYARYASAIGIAPQVLEEAVLKAPSPHEWSQTLLLQGAHAVAGATAGGSVGTSILSASTPKGFQPRLDVVSVKQRRGV